MGQRSSRHLTFLGPLIPRRHQQHCSQRVSYHAPYSALSLSSHSYPTYPHDARLCIRQWRAPHGSFSLNAQLPCNGYHLRHYMQHRFAWSDTSCTGINHYLFGLHFRSINPNQQVKRMKFVYDQQPLGARLATRTAGSSDVPDLDRCPCCREHRKDQSHIRRCTDNSSHSSSSSPPFAEIPALP